MMKNNANTRKWTRHSFIHSLHTKVTLGYILLVGALVGIVLLMYLETNRLITLYNRERQREESRTLVNQIFCKLLDISLPGELLPLWEESDFRCYEENNRYALITLDSLKKYYPDSSQTARIDSARLLLVEKEVRQRDLFDILNQSNSTRKNQPRMLKMQTDSLKKKE